MLLVAIEFRVDTVDRARFVEIAETLTDATREEEGCTFFEFWSDLGETGLFLAHEGWESLADLERHRTTPHVAAFKSAAAEIGARVVTASYFDATPTTT